MTVKKISKSLNEDVVTKACSDCGKSRALSLYYMSSSPYDKDNRMNVCKSCLKKNINYEKMNSIEEVLIAMNRPFLFHTWNSAVEESNKTGKDLFGIYCKNIMFNFKDLTWKDSIHEPSNKVGKVDNKSDDQIDNSIKLNDTEKLKDKYGYGYPDDEYMLFEKKYQELRTSFQLLTTMHEEYFKEYCINRVKETLAKAKNDFKQAKEWATMVKDVAEAGKLKPSQMSKADLSGGLDTFGQLARMVEENYEIMPLLPQFIEQPKDKVDVTLWCFINYVRDLKGLPECEYKEIYEFYNRKKEDYESQISDKKPDVDEEDDLDE